MSFKDDPLANFYDRHGIYFNKYTSAYHIGIGDSITWEKAQEEYRSEVSKRKMENRKFDKNRFSEEYLRKC